MWWNSGSDLQTTSFGYYTWCNANHISWVYPEQISTCKSLWTCWHLKRREYIFSQQVNRQGQNADSVTSPFVGKGAWEVPFAELADASSIRVLDSFYTGYGEVSRFGTHVNTRVTDFVKRVILRLILIVQCPFSVQSATTWVAHTVERDVVLYWSQ